MGVVSKDDLEGMVAWYSEEDGDGSSGLVFCKNCMAKGKEVVLVAGYKDGLVNLADMQADAQDNVAIVCDACGAVWVGDKWVEAEAL